jgi:hypothetical protein
MRRTWARIGTRAVGFSGLIVLASGCHDRDREVTVIHERPEREVWVGHEREVHVEHERRHDAHERGHEHEHEHEHEHGHEHD